MFVFMSYPTKSGSSKTRMLVTAAVFLAATGTAALAGRGGPDVDLSGETLAPGTIISSVAEAREVKRVPTQYFISVGCAGAHLCSEELLSIGRKKRFEMKDISCTVSIRDGGRPLNFATGTSGDAGATSARFLVPQFGYSAGNLRVYRAGRLVHQFVGPRETLRLSGQASTEFSYITCSISGDLVTLR